MSTQSIQDAIVEHLINKIEAATLGEQKAKKKVKEPEPHPRKDQIEAAISADRFGCARKDVIKLVAILTGVRCPDASNRSGRLKGDCIVSIVKTRSYSNHSHPLGRPLVCLTKEGNCFAISPDRPLRYDYVMAEEVRPATTEEATEFIKAIKANTKLLSDWINQFSIKAFNV